MIRKTIPYALLAAGALITAYPFVWMVTASFKSLQEATTPGFALFPETWLWGSTIVSEPRAASR